RVIYVEQLARRFPRLDDELSARCRCDAAMRTSDFAARSCTCVLTTRTLVAKFSVGRATIGCWCRGDGTRGVSATEIPIPEEGGWRHGYDRCGDAPTKVGIAISETTGSRYVRREVQSDDPPSQLHPTGHGDRAIRDGDSDRW